MATKTATKTEVGNYARGDLYLWETITAADTGGAVDVSDYDRFTIQVLGTFDGATIAIKGALDGTNYINLTKQNSVTAATATAGTQFEVTELPRHIIVATSGGGAAQDVDVYMYARRYG